MRLAFATDAPKSAAVCTCSTFSGACTSHLRGAGVSWRRSQSDRRAAAWARLSPQLRAESPARAVDLKAGTGAATRRTHESRRGGSALEETAAGKRALRVRTSALYAPSR